MVIFCKNGVGVGVGIFTHSMGNCCEIRGGRREILRDLRNSRSEVQNDLRGGAWEVGNGVGVYLDRWSS